ncbi:MAG: hypothetical protein RLZZ488_50 [Pseudomonadota bacterium]|jgi:histidinol-phosphate aminotransferase
MTGKVLSLHRNEYYYEHSPSVRHLLAGPVAPELVSTYSTRETLDTFIKNLAAALNIPSELVTLYHGAEDALFKILSWAAGRQMTVHTTSSGWAEYMRMMQGLELEVKLTNLKATAEQYSHPTEEFELALAQEPARCLVLLASPNNPTGHEVSAEEIIRLAKRFSQHVFLIDKVYNEFSAETFAPLSRYENIISVGSFSKFFGLPGLRVGFAVGRVPAVQTMALGPSPWALQICDAALSDRDYYNSNWQHMRNTCRLLQDIQSSAGHFLKTQAPFVLFRCSELITPQAVSTAQQAVALRGKIITLQPQIEIRWSLGSPEAYQRITECIRQLENQ